MTYKTLLLHINDAEKLPTEVNYTAQLANRFQAHTIGLVTESVPGINRRGVNTDHEMENIAKKVNSFETLCETSGINSYQVHIAKDDPSGLLIQQARCSDLLIINQPHIQSNIQPDKRLAESALLNTGKPCLFIPYTGSFSTTVNNIMLAWDGSREAARAASDALPLLVEAESVEVVMIHSNKRNSQASKAMVDTDIARFLARHEVNVEMKEIDSDIDIGNTLLSHAADSGADLCVMGAYGHSRVHEWIWGGATRTILDTMTLPVFMSH